MRLSLIQFFKKTVPGHIFRGKKRLVKQVDRPSMRSLIREFELQENNMLLLRHPYLTLAESSGHAKALNKATDKIKEWGEAATKKKLKPHITLEDRLFHLRVKDAWE